MNRLEGPAPWSPCLPIIIASLRDIRRGGRVWEKLAYMLKSVGAGFAGANSDRLFEIGDEDLAVADLARLCNLDDCANGRLQLGIVDNNFDFHFRDEVDPILGAAVHFG